MTTNKKVLDWVEEMKALVKPDKVVWIDGSEAQLKELRDQALATGEMEALNPEKLPGCLLHRTAVNDVARVEGRTYICSRKQEDAGPTNNWEDPVVMYDRLRKLYDGAMKGRTMYVLPYCMGPILQGGHRADRLDLCGAEYGHHDPHGPAGAGPAGG